MPGQRRNIRYRRINGPVSDVPEEELMTHNGNRAGRKLTTL